MGLLPKYLLRPSELLSTQASRPNNPMTKNARGMVPDSTEKDRTWKSTQSVFWRKRPSYLNICLSKKLKKMRSGMVADRGQTLYGYVQSRCQSPKYENGF